MHGAITKFAIAGSLFLAPIDSVFALDHISFDEDILPLVETHCSSCHSENSRLPVWSDYQTSVIYQDKIVERVYQRRNMPPGNLSGLTDEERETFAAWVDQGCHE